MATLRETLELIITANATGAVKGLEQVGNTAEREMGRTSSSVNKLGTGLQVAGAAMVGFGAIALTGLLHAAGAARDAEAAHIRLTNSVANSTKVAADSTAAFEDLASALQSKTVFDDEAIQTSEALLIQFGLTKDQVMETTPLVADLAAKMGVDLQQATKAVGKAIEGSGGSLSKMGIIVDATKLQTDSYGAVVDKLREKVGGFAEEEGKTFEGRLAILKNKLNDIEEGVGTGVVSAFSKLATVLEGTTEKLGELDPQMLSTTGEFATFGAVALIGLGTMNIIVGTLLKARGNFQAVGSAIAGVTQEFGGLGATLIGLGPLLIPLAAVLPGIVVGLQDSARSTKESAAAQETYATALRQTTGELDDNVRAATAANLANNHNFQTLRDGGVDLRVLGDEIARPTEEFSKFSEQVRRASTNSTDLGAALNNARNSSDPFVRSLVEMHDQGKVSDGVLKTLVATAGGLNQDFSKARDQATNLADANKALGTSGLSAADGIDHEKESIDNAKTSTEKYAAAVKNLNDALHAQFDPLFALVDATRKNEQAQNDVVAANLKVIAAQQELSNITKAYGKDNDAARDASLKLVDAQNELESANLDASKSAIDMQTATTTLVGAVKAHNISVDDATRTLDSYVFQGKITQQSADATKQKFYEVTYAALSAPSDVTIPTSAPGSQDAISHLEAVNSWANALNGRVIRMDVDVNFAGAGNAFGFPGATFRAGGGPVTAGQPYIVGESGKELFVPKQSGVIVPNDRLKTPTSAGGAVGGGSMSYSPTFNVVVNGSNLSADEVVSAIKKYEQRNGTGWRN